MHVKWKTNSGSADNGSVYSQSLVHFGPPSLRKWGYHFAHWIPTGKSCWISQLAKWPSTKSIYQLKASLKHGLKVRHYAHAPFFSGVKKGEKSKICLNFWPHFSWSCHTWYRLMHICCQLAKVTKVRSDVWLTVAICQMNCKWVILREKLKFNAKNWKGIEPKRLWLFS